MPADNSSLSAEAERNETEASILFRCAYLQECSRILMTAPWISSRCLCLGFTFYKQLYVCIEQVNLSSFFFHNLFHRRLTPPFAPLTADSQDAVDDSCSSSIENAREFSGRGATCFLFVYTLYVTQLTWGFSCTIPLQKNRFHSVSRNINWAWLSTTLYKMFRVIFGLVLYGAVALSTNRSSINDDEYTSTYNN